MQTQYFVLKLQLKTIKVITVVHIVQVGHKTHDEIVRYIHICNVYNVRQSYHR